MEQRDEKLIKGWIEYEIKEERNRIELAQLDKQTLRLKFGLMFFFGVVAGCIICKIITKIIAN